MRWFWRLLTLFILLGFLRTLIVPQPKSFIVWSDRSNWAQTIQGQMKQLQKISHDLPACIQVEVRRLWKDFQPNGDGKEV